MRHKGQNNQAGDLQPETSPWGQALRRGTFQLLEHNRPIGGHATGFNRGFGGTVGAVVTRVANSLTLGQQTEGYFGDAPQTLQDIVDAPPPYKRV